ncbi:MAG TPA: hypothetical protein VMS64_29665 [Candidatus Methylomirabilis sp.]|nr:hypothetical protein [Candidatus Methylomirabilis sp.]
MRTISKLVTLLLCVMLATPGLAQVPAAPGTADPLGLASIGVVIPFYTTGNNISYLEVASPVGNNPDLHVTFFGAACGKKSITLGLPVTTNGIQVFDLNTLFSSSFGGAFNGLLLISGVDETGFRLIPLQNPIHARVRWINTAEHFVRTLEPITVANAEAASSQTWNPLRTAATFTAPLQSSTAEESTLYLICPTAKVIDAISGAPALNPAGATTILFRVYDDLELFVRDFNQPCSCTTKSTLTDLNPVYGGSVAISPTYYTEMFGSIGSKPGSFTAYIGTRTISAGQRTLDDFHRLHNGNANDIDGSAAIDTQDR